MPMMSAGMRSGVAYSFRATRPRRERNSAQGGGASDQTPTTTRITRDYAINAVEGSIFEMLATIHHFGRTTEETIIREHDIGPLSVNYLKPAYDAPHR
jgi:hypothetical protein